MRVSLTGLDREIQQLEQRIADDRAAFAGAMKECGHSARETMSSPKSLLAVAAVGFVAGKLMFRPARTKVVEREHSGATAGGALGLLAAGLSLMRPGYGAGGVARWALQQLWERRRKQKQGAAARAAPPRPRSATPTATPAVRMPARATRESSSTTAAASR